MAGWGTGVWGTGTWGSDDGAGVFAPGVGTAFEPVDEFPLESIVDIKHKYRYLITMARNTGAPIGFGRIDTVAGQVLEHESASNGTPIRENDYLNTFTFNDISELEDHNNEIILNPPVNDNAHYTHYAIYRTKNTVADDADFATVQDTFFYVDEVPVTKMGFSISFTIESNQKSGLFSFESKTMGVEDVGSTIVAEDLSHSFIIVAFIERTGDLVTFRIADENGSDVTNTVNDIWYTIGNEEVFVGTRGFANNGDVLYSATSGRDFTEDDVGQQIFWADGNVSFIKQFNSITEVALEEPDGAPTDFNTVGDFIATMGYLTRVYNDTISDEQLTIYQRSEDNFYFLQTRFFEPLPNGGFGAIKGGAYFVSSVSNSEYYYSQLRDLYRTGSYHPSLQLNTKPIGVISRLRGYPDVLVIFGKNFTYYLDTTIEINGGEELFGEFVLVLSDPKLITKKVGLFSEGCAAEVDGGGELILTNEPAVRHFNGFKYGENIALNLIQDSEIAQLKLGVVMEWDKRRGLNIWGVNG